MNKKEFGRLKQGAVVYGAFYLDGKVVTEPYVVKFELVVAGCDEMPTMKDMKDHLQVTEVKAIKACLRRRKKTIESQIDIWSNDLIEMSKELLEVKKQLAECGE